MLAALGCGSPKHPATPAKAIEVCHSDVAARLTRTNRAPSGFLVSKSSNHAIKHSRSHMEWRVSECSCFVFMIINAKVHHVFVVNLSTINVIRSVPIPLPLTRAVIFNFDGGTSPAILAMLKSNLLTPCIMPVRLYTN